MGEAPVHPGDILDGKYRVERLLGAGGMGVVVAARHQQLDERVAIKFLLEEALDNEVRVARFVREARAAARIHSEYAARVHDVGQLESGLPYMVMEYLDGEDLDQRLRRDGPLPVAEAAELLLQACEALAAAHAQGIVHRDVKPSNLFLAKRQDGSTGVKVIDFGISKVPLEVENTDTDSDSGMTQSQTMIGSPHYMAPEQMRSAKHVDMRADIWGLGTTLHKMLTVKTPFKGNTVMAIFEDILNGYQGVLRHNEQLPVAIDAVVRRCLCLALDDRYANVAELAYALAPFAPSRALHLVERIEGTLRAAGMLGEEHLDSRPSAPLSQGAGAAGGVNGTATSSGDESLAHNKTVTMTEPAAESPGHEWPQGVEAEDRDTAGLTTQEAWSELGGQRRSGSRVRLGLAVVAAAALLIAGALWMGASADDKPDEAPAAFAVEAASARPTHTTSSATSAGTGMAASESDAPPASTGTAQPTDAAQAKAPARPKGSAQRKSPEPGTATTPTAPPAAPRTPAPAKPPAPSAQKPELWGTPW